MNYIKLFISGTCTTLIYILGGFDIALQSLLLVILFDYITGLLSAIYNKEVSSKIGFKGIIKKIALLCGVALSVVIDNITGSSGVIRTGVIYFFVANEGISILENLAEMNIKMPKKIIDILSQLKKENK